MTTGMQKLIYTAFYFNNKKKNHDDIYSAVISGASHIWEFKKIWFLWTKVGQRQVAANSSAKL